MLKISGGEWKGRSLKSPAGAETRPTSAFLRESVFNVLQNGMGREFKNVLDLFAGTGALGLEALSRGAERAVFAEASPRTLKTLEQNIAAVAAKKQTRVLRDSDPKRWLKHLVTLTEFLPFDLVLCDPPYKHGWIGKSFAILEDPVLWSPSSLLVAEMAPGESIELEHWVAVKEKLHGDSKVVFLERRPE